MKIELVEIIGYRNFASSVVNLLEKTLIIGANDVGKTNFLRAIRLLLDRSLSDDDLIPNESDFHIKADGIQVSEIKILLKLSNIKEDSVISRLKGYISADGECFIIYSAQRPTLDYKLSIGHSRDACENVEGRYYLKHVHFKYVESSRDITQYIQREKKYLLKAAKQKRNPGQEASDAASESTLQHALNTVNTDINKLSYVSGATTGINEKLKALSHHNADYSVNLETQALDFGAFVERLHLGATAGGKRVGLGGDGRNNQILVGLWMAKAAMEHDLENEVVIYCIEEPEAHLHPHQQRKLADYLVNNVKGQVLVTTHSPQIASEFEPAGIVRLLENNGNTVAAKNGCSKELEGAWGDFGYRMSIVPAEAFFADVVLLVEGPSEVLFYIALAAELEIDLDFYNISILPIDGIDFDVYIAILSKMEIPTVLRTDNDVFKVPHSNPPQWRFAGLNRVRKIAGQPGYPHSSAIDTPQKLQKEWAETSTLLNPLGIFVSRVDLENDVASACAEALLKYSGEEEIEAAVNFLQNRKAIRMEQFLNSKENLLIGLKDDALAAPLHYAVRLAGERRPGRK